MRTNGLIKITFYKATGKLTSKSIEQYPFINQSILDYMIYFANGRIILPELTEQNILSANIIVADNYITAPSIYWDALAQLESLIKKLEKSLAESTGKDIWKNTTKTVRISRKI
jgi:hypothetical protein